MASPPPAFELLIPLLDTEYLDFCGYNQFTAYAMLDHLLATILEEGKCVTGWLLMILVATD
jgi:hypothetical protein